MFQYLKNVKTYHKQIRLFSILIKMLNYFIYAYNDNSFCDYVIGNKKEEILKVKFVYEKNELGRLMTRSTIRILYYTIAIKKLNKLNLKDNKTCEEIIEYGAKIFNLMIAERENYFVNAMNKNLDLEIYLEAVNIPEDDEKLIKINDEASNIEKCFSMFYSFDLDNMEVIKGVNDSLKKVIVFVKNSRIHGQLSKSNFFFSFNKIIIYLQF